MNKLLKLIFCMTIVSVVAACGDSSSSAKQVGVNSSHVIEGTVTDRDELIVSGKIVAKDKNGATIATAEPDQEAHYLIALPPGSAYPVTLEIAVDKNTLLEAVVMDSALAMQDISTMSTLVVESARNLGGLTKQNMAQAAINAIRQNKKSSGKGTSTGFKGDPTKQYGGWH
ncbi:hypothetical protein [Methylotuvimicrobium sp.]|uniref:hypothetical protein n=1 Tax=Methylotuvimicrobium sp. TaxID=2822413 RepID=UPI003D649677